MVELARALRAGQDEADPLDPRSALVEELTAFVLATLAENAHPSSRGALLAELERIHRLASPGSARPE